MPAPKNNVNAARNGSSMREAARQLARPLSIGEMPKPLARVTRDVRKYRRYLEDCVTREHGKIDDEQHHLIDEACACEVHAAVCRWLMRTKLDTMSHADILACSREIPRTKRDRNRAIERLKLNSDSRSIIDALYSATPHEPDPDEIDAHEASEATVDDSTTTTPTEGA